MQDQLPPLDGSSGSLADAAYRAIEEMIVTRRLPPGSMISENQLSEELGCGRTPIREALQRLKLEGFVEVHPRRGVLVSSIDVLKQLELLEVRRSLEILVVRLAAERASPAERARMRQLADEIRDAAAALDAGHYLRVVRAIQEVEAAATRNPLLARMIGVVHGLSRRFWYAQTQEPGSVPEGFATHAATLTAIAAGDADAAAACASRHLDYLERLTRSALDRHLSR